MSSKYGWSSGFPVFASTPEKLIRETLHYQKKYRLSVVVLSFRDQILPELFKKISTSHYEDEVLRTLSLLRQYELQVQKLQGAR